MPEIKPNQPSDDALALIAWQWSWTLITHLTPDLCPCYGCKMRRHWQTKDPFIRDSDGWPVGVK